MADEDEIMIRVRTPIALAREAQRVAALHDESVSQVIRRALRAYVAAAPRQTDLEDAIAASRNLRSRAAVKKPTPVVTTREYPVRSRSVVIGKTK
jgi:hypothetical protein